MIEHDLGNEYPITWEDFKKEIKKESSENVFYRGQNNSDYPLQTTLARYLPNFQSYAAHKYHKKIRLIAEAKPELRSMLDKVPQEFLLKNNFMHGPQDIEKVYATFLLMMHLRHHGVPSPLLDWTRNPYVAAFFAASNVEKIKDDFAIFLLKKTGSVAQIRSGHPLFPRLLLIDNSEILDTHFNHFPENKLLLQRHRAQNSVYTICYEGSEVSANVPQEIIYTMIDQAGYILSLPNANANDEIYNLKKYVISASERKQVLYELFKMGINNKEIYGDFSFEDLSIEHLFFDESYS